MWAAAGLLVPTAPPAAYSQAVELVAVDVTTLAKGYRTSKLTGSSVMNAQNEKIGTIDDFIIDRERVLFSVLQVGGFLGIGGRLLAVPYQSLLIDDTRSQNVLPHATEGQLHKLP